MDACKPAAAHACRRAVRVACGVLLWTLACPARPAGAIVVVQRSFQDLVSRAEQIVAGTVTSVLEMQDERGAPATFVTFSDLTVLKGDVGDTLTLRLYGGSAAGVVSYIPHLPTFTVGERAVVFVAGNGRDVCPLVGVWQGRFRVRFDAALGTDVVETNDGRSVTGVVGGELQRGEGGGAAAAGPMTLTDFLESIAGEMQRSGATVSR